MYIHNMYKSCDENTGFESAPRDFDMPFFCPSVKDLRLP